jgi:hypothetical protein
MWSSINSQSGQSSEAYSSIGSPCYALAGKSDSFVKNSDQFAQLLKSVNLQSSDTLVNYDIFGLFANVPVDEAV